MSLKSSSATIGSNVDASLEPDKNAKMECTSGFTWHNYPVYPGEHCLFRSIHQATDPGIEIDNCKLVLRKRIWQQWCFEGT